MGYEDDYHMLKQSPYNLWILVKLWWLCFSRGANSTSVGPLVLFLVMTNASLQRISTWRNQVVELNIANFLVRFVLDRQTRRWQRQDGNRPVEWPRHGLSLPHSHQHTDTGPLSVSAPPHLHSILVYGQDQVESGQLSFTTSDLLRKERDRLESLLTLIFFEDLHGLCKIQRLISWFIKRSF